MQAITRPLPFSNLGSLQLVHPMQPQQSMPYHQSSQKNRDAPRAITPAPSSPRARTSYEVIAMSDCPFCNIAQHWPPSDNPSGNHELITPSAFVVLSAPLVVAFLDSEYYLSPYSFHIAFLEVYISIPVHSPALVSQQHHEIKQHLN